MSNPPTPSFHMENTRPNDYTLEAYIKSKTDPIFNKILKEVKTNTMSVGKPITFLWRPNNYRLQIPFITKRFKRNTTLKPSVRVYNYGTKYTIMDFYNTTIMLDTPRKKPASMTVIYKPGRRYYYSVKSASIKGVQEFIDKKVTEIENTLISAANEFKRRFGGELLLKARKWIRHEDEVKQEDFIDKLPQDLIIHDTYFKKAYKQGVEFKSPVFVKNYISNRSIEDLTPEIANSLNSLGNKFDLFIDKVLPPIEDLSENIKTHLTVLKGIDKSFKKFNKLLSERQKKLNEF